MRSPLSKGACDMQRFGPSNVFNTRAATGVGLPRGIDNEGSHAMAAIKRCLANDDGLHVADWNNVRARLSQPERIQKNRSPSQ